MSEEEENAEENNVCKKQRIEVFDETTITGLVDEIGTDDFETNAIDSKPGDIENEITTHEIVDDVADNTIAIGSKQGDADISENSANLECSLCLGTGSEENALLESHNCGQCRTGAWKICHNCDEKLLSRTCPVCRGDYAPLILHAVPRISYDMILNKSLGLEEKKEVFARLHILKVSASIILNVHCSFVQIVFLELFYLSCPCSW